MNFPGNVINGTIVLDPPAVLADGTRVEVVVREPGQSEDTQLRRRFQQLVHAWKDAKVFISSGTEIALNPAYQQIIGMGKEALPLILEELQCEPDHWFWALKAITGEDPVASGDRGNLPKMTEAWLGWARTHGYLPCP